MSIKREVALTGWRASIIRRQAGIAHGINVSVRAKSLRKRTAAAQSAAAVNARLMKTAWGG